MGKINDGMNAGGGDDGMVAMVRVDMEGEQWQGVAKGGYGVVDVGGKIEWK